MKREILRVATDTEAYLKHIGWYSTCRKRCIATTREILKKCEFAAGELSTPSLTSILMDCGTIRTYMRNLPFTRNDRISLHTRLKKIEKVCLEFLQPKLAFKSR